MQFFEFLNDNFSRTVHYLEDKKYLNLFLYLIIAATICGFILGIIEFIERSYSLGYILGFNNKIQGLLFNSSILSIELTSVFLPLALLFIIILYLTSKSLNEFKIFNVNINTGLIVFTGAISLIVTFFIKYQCFDNFNKNFISQFVLQSDIFNSIFSSIVIAVIATFLLNLLAFKLSNQKEIAIEKLCLLFNSAGFIMFLICLIIVPIRQILINAINNLYQQLSYLNQFSNILSLTLIFLLLMLFLFIIVANVIVFISLFKNNKIFKISFTFITFLLFAFTYLITVNFFFTHFNFLPYFAEITFTCAIIATFFFYILIIVFLNLVGFNLESIKSINKKKLISRYFVILIILLVSIFLLKPDNNVLKAFIYRNIIIHQGMINFKLKPALNMLPKANATLPISNICKTSNNEQISLAFKNKPNIILISIDAMRYNYSTDVQLIKNLNKLSNQSYVFKNCYSHGSHTAASFASMFLSKYFGSIKHYNFPSLIEIIRDYNYKTLAISGNNFYSEKIPIDYIKVEDIKYETPIIKGFDTIVMSNHLSEHTEKADKMVARVFKKYVDSYDKPDKPLFAWLHFFEPHDTSVEYVFYSMLSKKPFKNEYLRRLALVDINLGNVLQTLKSNNLYDESLIIVIADHGDEIKDHGGFYHKYSLYNELIHVPLLIKMPYQKQKIEINTPVSLLDLYPTILQIAGIKEIKANNLCGESLLPLMFGINKKHKLPISSIYLGRIDKVKEKPAISALKIKHTPSKYYFDELFKLSIIDKNNEWKLIYNLDPEFYELYNLKQDPEEKKNLADIEKDKLNELITALNNQINSK